MRCSEIQYRYMYVRQHDIVRRSDQIMFGVGSTFAAARCVALAHARPSQAEFQLRELSVMNERSPHAPNMMPFFQVGLVHVLYAVPASRLGLGLFIVRYLGRDEQCTVLHLWGLQAIADA
jgi:hypothetical protein